MHEGNGRELEHRRESEQPPTPTKEQQLTPIRIRGHIETCLSPRKPRVAHMHVHGPHLTAARQADHTKQLLYKPVFETEPVGPTHSPAEGMAAHAAAKAPTSHWEQPRTARSLQASLDAAQEAHFEPPTFSPLTPAPRFAPAVPSLSAPSFSTPVPASSVQQSKQQAATPTAPAAVREPPLLSGVADQSSFPLRQLLQEQPPPPPPQQQPSKMHPGPLSASNASARNDGIAAALVPDMQLLNTVWHLPVFEFSLHRLSNLAAQMLVTGQSMALAPLLEAFANTVILEGHAPQLPRHDARHAVLQLHFCWRVMQATGAHQYMDPLQRLALCLAALCSHINHPGLSATALEELEHPMATRYAALAAAGIHRDFAAAPTVIQCHHCAVAVAFLGSPSHNVLHSMPQPEACALREALCTILCSTDARQHFHVLAAAAHAIPSNHQGLQSLHTSPKFSLSFSCQLARCAQLVRFFLPWDTAKHLQDMEEKEERMQADLMAQHSRSTSSAAQPSPRAQELALLDAHAAPSLQMLAWMVGDAAAASLRPLFDSLHHNRTVLRALIQDSGQ